MIVQVNGREEVVDSRASVADVVGALIDRQRGVAVAVNGEVVPRSQWHDHVLLAGDRVEVVTAVGGG